ncbi:MAG: beta strand repeat-containing protein [Chthoniobacterales bacterium]
MKQLSLIAVLVIGANVLALKGANAQATGDYRSAVSTGLWATAASWERFNGSTWVTAPSAPTTTDGAINILNANTISLGATTSIDQLTVDSGGQFTVNSGVAWTLANSAVPGFDLTVSGTVLNSGGTITIGSGATWTVLSGGTYIHNTTSGISTPLTAATLATGSNFIYRGSSTLVPAASVSGRTYYNLSFDSTSGSWTTGAFSGSGIFTVNGDLTVGTGVSVNFGTYTGTFSTNGNVSISGTLGTNTAAAGAASFTIASGKALSVASGGTLNMGSGKTVTIASGGSLTGAGTLSGLIAMNGTLSPGTAGPGTLTLGASTLTLSSTSAFAFDLGTSADLISLTGGTLALGSGVIDFSDFTFTPGAGFTDTIYNLITGASSVTGSLGVGISGLVTAGYNGTISLSGNNLILTVTAAVPEPHEYAIAIAGLLGVVIYRRRRRMV